VLSHDSINVFEVLEHSQTRLFLFASHELLEIIVGIQLDRCSSHIVKSLGWTGRGSFEFLVAVQDFDHGGVNATCGSSVKEMSLTKELAAMRGRLDFLIVVD
jgi:hypothetical protein